MKKIAMGILMVILSVCLYAGSMTTPALAAHMGTVNVLCMAAQFVGAILTVMGILEVRGRRR